MKTMADVLRERGKLGPYGQAQDPPPAPARVVDNAAVRAWAAEHGLSVGARGPIPPAVLRRYREEAADGAVDL